jgi:guanylate kinase
VGNVPVNLMVYIIILPKRSLFSQVEQGGFIEYAEVFGNYYGTSQATVKEQLEKVMMFYSKLTGKVQSKFVTFS